MVNNTEQLFVEEIISPALKIHKNIHIEKWKEMIFRLLSQIFSLSCSKNKKGDSKNRISFISFKTKYRFLFYNSKFSCFVTFCS